MRTLWAVAVAKGALDALAVLLSFALGHVTYHGMGLVKDQRPLTLYLTIAVAAAGVVIVVFERLGLYRPQASVLNIEEVRGTSRGVLVAGLAFLALSFYIRDERGDPLSRVITTLSFAWLLVVANTFRVCVHKLTERLHAEGIGCRRVLLFDAGPLGVDLLRRLFAAPEVGFVPVGFVADRPEAVGQTITGTAGRPHTEVRVIGTLDDLPRLVDEARADELFVALGQEDLASAREAFARCDAIGLPYRFVPHIYGFPFHELSVDQIDGMPLMHRRGLPRRPFYDAVKRLFDVVTSLLFLIVSSPLFVVLALLIRRESSGPALFTQERVGHDGRVFTIYKFRTMAVDTPRYEYHPKDRLDPRLTRVGRFLRRLSLDELPQLYNVLKGDMSLVGPRPEMPFIVAGYGEIERVRLKVKPGITGLWQISLDRTRMIHENMDYDLYYVHHRSFLLDLIILVETAFKVIPGTGAR